MRLPVAVGGFDGDGWPGVGFDGGVDDSGALVDVDAVAFGVVEQHLVEGWSPDLVGVGVGGVGLGEVPGPGFGVAAPDHGGAVLGGEAGGFNLADDAEGFENGDGGGEEGFADVFSGEDFSLEEDDLEALSGEEGGGGGASGASADDDDPLGHGESLLSVRSHRTGRATTRVAPTDLQVGFRDTQKARSGERAFWLVAPGAGISRRTLGRRSGCRPRRLP